MEQCTWPTNPRKKLVGCIVLLTLSALVLFEITSHLTSPIESISQIVPYRQQLLKFLNISSQAQTHLPKSSNISTQPQTSVQIMESFTRRTKEKCRKQLPKALIVGFAKCGTGTLINFLDSHPQIAAVLDPREVYYFNTDKYNRGENWYRQIMPCCFADQIAIEKTPSYALSSKVPARVYQMRKDMKIIFLVRDPVERIISHYTMQTQVRREKRSKNNKTLSALQDTPLSQFVLDSYGNVDRNKRYVLISLYYEHIKKWLQYFQLDDIHVVHGEQFVQQPPEELKKLEKYLNIHPFFNNDTFIFNATKNFYCLHLGGEMQCMRPGKGRKHLDIEDNLRKKLYLFFEKENVKLYHLLGRNFNWTYR